MAPSTGQCLYFWQYDIGDYAFHTVHYLRDTPESFTPQVVHQEPGCETSIPPHVYATRVRAPDVTSTSQPTRSLPDATRSLGVSIDFFCTTNSSFWRMRNRCARERTQAHTKHAPFNANGRRCTVQIYAKHSRRRMSTDY